MTEDTDRTTAQSSSAQPAQPAPAQSPSLLVRAIWYLFIGWWATGLWLAVAWALNATIVGIPLGIKMINKTPYVLSLKKTTEHTVGGPSGESPHIAVRAVYFAFVGWWASGLLTVAAYLISLTVIGIPVAVKLYNWLPFVVSLKK